MQMTVFNKNIEELRTKFIDAEQKFRDLEKYK